MDFSVQHQFVFFFTLFSTRRTFDDNAYRRNANEKFPRSSILQRKMPSACRCFTSTPMECSPQTVVMPTNVSHHEVAMSMEFFFPNIATPTYLLRHIFGLLMECSLLIVVPLTDVTHHKVSLFMVCASTC
jgi:hypothetical protein